MKIIGRIKDGALKPKPKVTYEVGDAVRVIDGPFANFQGVVDEVYPDKGRVRVMVSIFGRETPVELDFLQVEGERRDLRLQGRGHVVLGQVVQFLVLGLQVT